MAGGGQPWYIVMAGSQLATGEVTEHPAGDGAHKETLLPIMLMAKISPKVRL